MSFLVDTHVISEVRRGPRCNVHVARWFATVDDDDVYVSVLALGEIRKGVELARSKDAKRASALEAWLRELHGAFAGRILAVDRAIADEWGRLVARRPLAWVDGLLAATAIVHGLTLVTRAARKIEDTGADVLDPFRAA